MLSLDELPSPRGLPLLGNSLTIKPSRIYQTLCDWAEQLGSRYTFKIGRQRILVVSDPVIIAQLLRERPGKFRRWVKMEELGLEVGADGVFVAEGDKWRRHRELVVPAFNGQHIEQFWERLKGLTDRLEERWRQVAHSGESVDMRKESMRYTVDVVTGFAFGSVLDTLSDKNSALQGYLSMFLQTAARRQAALFPYWRYVKLKWDRDFDVALASINQIVHDLIERARTHLGEDPQAVANPANLVEALVASQAKDSSATITDGEIIGNVLTFLLAGEDTTANTIAWTVYYISRYPDVQKKMQLEIDGLLGRASGISSMKQIEALPYINAVIQESMRLKPVFPLLTLEPNDAVEVAGVAVEKGTPLFLLLGRPGQQETFFKQSAEFQPDRWLNHSNFSGDHPKAFMPFGSGPRYCPGHRLAKLECVMAISMLVKNFTVVPDPQACAVQEQYAFTLCPSQVSVVLQERHRL